jgi:hypothetical protein
VGVGVDANGSFLRPVAGTGEFPVVVVHVNGDAGLLVGLYSGDRRVDLPAARNIMADKPPLAVGPAMHPVGGVLVFV